MCYTRLPVPYQRQVRILFIRQLGFIINYNKFNCRARIFGCRLDGGRDNRPWNRRKAFGSRCHGTGWSWCRLHRRVRQNVRYWPNGHSRSHGTGPGTLFVHAAMKQFVINSAKSVYFRLRLPKLVFMLAWTLAAQFWPLPTLCTVVMTSTKLRWRISVYRYCKWLSSDRGAEYLTLLFLRRIRCCRVSICCSSSWIWWMLNRIGVLLIMSFACIVTGLRTSRTAIRFRWPWTLIYYRLTILMKMKLASRKRLSMRSTTLSCTVLHVSRRTRSSVCNSWESTFTLLVLSRYRIRSIGNVVDHEDH